jgi:tetratricopeptide (TPR) repeat protein
LHDIIVFRVIKSVLFESDKTRILAINTKTRQYPCILLLLLSVIACLGPARGAQAMTAEEYFADGNRLFRDDLYWAALLRYRQAADEGLDTPLLHYNAGIAHYRAGQHVRARAELEKALADPGLRVAAQYNLGLNAYALGDTDEALRWFRLVRDQNVYPKLQRYAVVAIARIRDGLAAPDDFEIRVVERKKKRDFADLQMHAVLGFGSDSNAFRSPDIPYIDFSDPATPVVTPVVQSGTFVPASFSAKYLVNSLPFEGFYVQYRLSGHYYTDTALENANEYQHEASFGSEYLRKEAGREREVHSAFTVAQHDETYYDPDDGVARNINGVNINDRMSYLRYGPEFSLRQSWEHISIGARIKGQLWNYAEQTVVPEYDHEYFVASLYGQWKFTSTSLLRLTLEGYSRRFGDRPSYDLDGQQRQGNPNIRYDYYSAKLTARQRVFDSLWFGLYAQRTERADQYVGYYDYTRDSFGAEVHWSPGDRFLLEASGEYRLYDYPNAFAFHDPAVGRKTQESAQAELVGAYRLTQHFSLVGRASYRETVSNDTRIQYLRNQYSLGVRWEF